MVDASANGAPPSIKDAAAMHQQREAGYCFARWVRQWFDPCSRPTSAYRGHGRIHCLILSLIRPKIGFYGPKAVKEDRCAAGLPQVNDMEALAIAVAHEFVKEHFLPPMDRDWRAFTEENISERCRVSAFRAVQKGHDKRWENVEITDGARSCLFQPKDQVKVKTSLVDPTKVPQGIAAWHQSWMIEIGSATKVMCDHLERNLRPHVVIDSGKAPSQFCKEVVDTANIVVESKQSAVTDQEEFDSNQNQFTQLIERNVWEMLGISTDFLDLYFSNRRNISINGVATSGEIKTAQTSGQPLTLASNGIVAAATHNYCVRRVQPAVFVFKGDDVYEQSIGVAADEEAIREIKSQCSLNPRVSIGGGDFCGFVGTSDSFVPSLPRLVLKILAHPFRSYLHFCEYQNSLRDTLNTIRNVGLAAVIRGNMAGYPGYTFPALPRSSVFCILALEVTS